MRVYKLLVAGVDVDTGEYEYFPFADKSILDYRGVSEAIRKIKSGETVVDVENYIYAKYCVSDDSLNEKAINAASEAFGKFQSTSISKRFKMLSDIRKRLIDKEKELLDLLIIEGHPAKLAEWEVLGMKDGLSPETLSFYKKQFRCEVGSFGNERMYWVRKPDGVVCLEPPRNAPCSNSFISVLTFIPGNSLIIKPPLRNPVATLFLWRDIVYPSLMDNGAPPGILNIILGNSKNILDQWLDSDKVNDIIYFGDSARGLRIGNQIFQKGKKPILELSGNDILVVWKDADLEAAATSLVDAFIGSTQICMVPKTALVHADIYDDFLKIMVKKVSFIKAGLPSNPETCLSPVTRIADFHEYLSDAVANEGEVIFGGRQLDSNHQADINGVFIEPTLVRVLSVEQALKMRCVKEETFFPLLPMVKVNAAPTDLLDKDASIFESMMEVINQNQYGLRFSLWARSPRHIRKFLKKVNNAGLFRVNSRHVGFSKFLASHGGPRQSGGPFGEMNYVWQKTSHLQGISIQKA